MVFKIIINFHQWESGLQDSQNEDRPDQQQFTHYFAVLIKIVITNQFTFLLLKCTRKFRTFVLNFINHSSHHISSCVPLVLKLHCINFVAGSECKL